MGVTPNCLQLKIQYIRWYIEIYLCKSITCLKFIKLLIFFLYLKIARGFGMRVVGGKTGADGRLFAYIVWTVPGGPAEKGGLQQGDKVNIIFKFNIYYYNKTFLLTFV